ncbi:MAG: hypothetical protein NTW21_04470 [Verrucomicrobia bacterium]|nr:hypothetical protein [Verrucomicrobiota bacterium]
MTADAKAWLKIAELWRRPMTADAMAWRFSYPFHSLTTLIERRYISFSPSSMILTSIP